MLKSESLLISLTAKLRFQTLLSSGLQCGVSWRWEFRRKSCGEAAPETRASILSPFYDKLDTFLSWICINFLIKKGKERQTFSSKGKIELTSLWMQTPRICILIDQAFSLGEAMWPEEPALFSGVGKVVRWKVLLLYSQKNRLVLILTVQQKWGKSTSSCIFLWVSFHPGIDSLQKLWFFWKGGEKEHWFPIHTQE